MAIRHRSSHGGERVGSYTRTYNGKTRYAGVVPQYSVCTDEIGRFGQENYFDLAKILIHGGRINGVLNPGSTTAEYTFNNYPCTLSRLTGTYLPNLNPPSSAFRDVYGAIASMHPGEPSVSLPVFLFELKDVPWMLRNAAKRAKQLEKAARNPSIRGVTSFLASPKARAEDYLNYQFGWSPLLRDLVDLTDIGPLIAKRMKSLSSAKRKLIRRKRSLGEWSETTEAWHPANATAYTPWAYCTKTAFAKKWVSAKFSIPDSVSGNLMRDDPWLAARIELGLDASLTHVWDALPWSWLVDWFADIGGLIHTKANRFGIRYQGGSVMYETQRRLRARVFDTQASIRTSPIDTIAVTKSRVPAGYVPIDFRGLNGLDSRQLGILSSLAVTRV